MAEQKNTESGYNYVYIVKNSGYFKTREDARKCRNLIEHKQRKKTKIVKKGYNEKTRRQFWIVTYANPEEK